MTRRVTIQRSITTHKDNKDPGKAKNQLWDTYIKKLPYLRVTQLTIYTLWNEYRK